MRRCIRYTTALAVLMTAIAPLPADAQIGRIKRIGADIVKDAAGVPDIPEKKASRDIAITPDRLDAVLAALSPRVDAARIEHEAKAAEKEFNAWTTAFNSCLEKSAGAAMPTAEGMEKGNAISVKMAPMMERMGKLVSSNDKRALEYLQDSLRVMGTESQIHMFGATKCGKVRYTPTAIIESRAARAMNTNAVVDESGIRWDIDVPASKRAGMSHYQFGMVRERMALWSLIQSGAIPGDKGGKDAVFSDAERAALTARSADITKLAPLFRDGSMRWTNWGDITSW